MPLINFIFFFLYFYSISGWGTIQTILSEERTMHALSAQQLKKLEELVARDFREPSAPSTRDLNWSKVVEEFEKSFLIIDAPAEIYSPEEWTDIGEQMCVEAFVQDENGSKDLKLSQIPNEGNALLKEAVNSQLLGTLIELGRQICEGQLCGKQACVYVNSFRCRKESNGDYTWVNLVCSDIPEQAMMLVSPNAITQEVLALGKPLAKKPIASEQPGYFTRMRSWLPSWDKTSVYCGNVFRNTAHAVYEDLVTQPMANAFNPTRIAMTTGQALLAAAVTDGYRAAKGSTEEFDWSSIPREADLHLARGQGVFTKSQVARVKSWIAHAKLGLQTYNAHKAEETKKLSTVAQEEKITIQKLMDQTEQAAKAGIVTATMLKEKGDMALLNLLSALQNFMLIPYEIAHASREEITQRIEVSPALGSEEYKKSIIERAHMIAANSYKEMVMQNKKVIISASGPGTGKTTGFEHMAFWAGVPICKLTGEEVNSWSANKNNVLSLINDWVVDCIKTKFRVNDKGVVNGLVLFDDFHYVFARGGALDEGSDSRAKFFSKFVKNGGDPSIESIISSDFSSGKEWPTGIERELDMNTSRIQFLLTLNEVPKELNADFGDQPTLDRTIRIDAKYLTREERLAFAREMLLGKNGLVADIAKIVGEKEAKKLSLPQCEHFIELVVQEDIRVAFGQFKGKFGFRGLIELLEQYKAHVLGKVSLPLDPKACSFEGKINFDVAQVVATMESYKGKINEKMKEEELNNELLVAIKGMRKEMEALPSLSPLENALIEVFIGTIENASAGEASRRAALRQAKQVLNTNKNLVELSSAEQAGLKILSSFGYLQALEGSEADRFAPVAEAIEDIHKRLSNHRKGIYLSANRLIQIGFTAEAALDPTLVDKIANILGGFPVLKANKANHIAKLVTVEDQWNLLPNETQLTKLQGFDSKSLTTKNVVYGAKTREFMRFATKFVRSDQKNTYFAISNDDLDGKPFFVLRSDKIKEFFTSLDSNNSSPEHDCFSLLPNPERKNISEVVNVISQYLKPKVQFVLWEELAARRASGLSYESLLSITLNKETLALIVNWYKKDVTTLQMNPEIEREALHAFRWYLHESINDPRGIRLHDGSIIDGRKVTIILLAPNNLKDILFDPELEQKLTPRARPINITLGPPPVEGRSIQATGFFTDALNLLLASMREEEHREIETIELQTFEQEALEALIAYDKKIASDARKAGGETPLQLLEQAVQTIVSVIKGREKNYFSFHQRIPTLGSLKASWVDIYKNHLEELKTKQAQENLRSRMPQLGQFKMNLLPRLDLDSTEACDSEDPATLNGSGKNSLARSADVDQ